jgi:hypothetical protein
MFNKFIILIITILIKDINYIINFKFSFIN